jgi:alcohol dehydrogenase
LEHPRRILPANFKALKKGTGISGFYVGTTKFRANKSIWSQVLFQFTQANRERLTKLAQWVDQNNIIVNIDKTFSLDEAAKALDYQKDAHPRDNVVLTV